MSSQVLLVEDNAELQNYMAELLRTAGFEVARAAHGEEAIQTLQKGVYNLIILDLFMPEKDGFETLTELRRILPRPKVLAISGGGRFSVEDTLAVAVRLGADDTLAKPFTPGQLLSAVRELLPEREMSPAA
jgi:DNA-binding response OmpR family regulator